MTFAAGFERPEECGANPFTDCGFLTVFELKLLGITAIAIYTARDFTQLTFCNLWASIRY